MGDHRPHGEHGSHAHHEAPSHLSHKAHASVSLSCMVVTCSDSRTKDTDTSGKLICHLLKEQGHSIAAYHLIKDEPEDITRLLEEAALQTDKQVVIINGGTGISRRDSTFEAVDGFLQKRLDGFGELFRYLSYQPSAFAFRVEAAAGLLVSDSTCAPHLSNHSRNSSA